MSPDLEVEFREGGKKVIFAIECKYRSKTNNGFIELGQEYQIRNYKNFAFEKKIAVFITLGIGGKANNPEELYLIPLEKINNNHIHLDAIKYYKRFPGLMLYYDLKLERLM
jgi:hypothetical protein